MESKQIWITVAIAIVVSLTVSLIVIDQNNGLQKSPTIINNTNQSTGPSLRLPDLVITRIERNSSSGGGSGGCGGGWNSTTHCYTSIYVTIKNIGRNSAGPSIVQLTIPDGNNTHIEYANISKLGPGRFIEVGLNSGYHIFGNYTAYAVADIWNQVMEVKENNNLGSYNFMLP